MVGCFWVDAEGLNVQFLCLQRFIWNDACSGPSREAGGGKHPSENVQEKKNDQALEIGNSFWVIKAKAQNKKIRT